ncbi:hypothetical protein [Nocardioides sp. L-11A]|uniref:phage terminase small subunit n=1 Tax=Nocardioides sp. L-11A TaxID=3043848 RepID=UPI00249BDDA1|nr:hypothetical protein QJ852_15295 [Nocardioides sp. L-11A]
MATMPNRTEDLTPAGERKRKQRGTTTVRGKSNPATVPVPDPEWSKAARMVWDSMLESGGAAYFESSDYAVLYIVCDQIEHLYQQGGRRSPEYLRVIMQALGALLATEGDRRKLHIELQKAPDDEEDFLAGLDDLFGTG